MNTQDRAREIRANVLRCINSIGSGHIGGSLSICDILAVLYEKHLRFDAANPKMEGRDRVVLSKGHAGPALYATLSSFGYFPQEMLLTLNKLGTKLPSHCNSLLTPGVDMTAGSLGHGISSAVGLALSSKISGDGARVYAIVGDGECQEGQVWEAAMLAAQNKLDNLTVFIDNNGMQIDDITNKVIKVEDLVAKWSAFNFETVRIDGHNHEALDKAITLAKNTKEKPFAIICDTVKGKGVKLYEEMGVGNHSTSVNAEQMRQALEELGFKG